MAAIEGKSLNPNLATVTQPVSGGHLLHEIDTVTNELIATVQQRQADGVAAGSLQPPRCSRPFLLARFVPLAELRSVKRQFMKLAMEPGQTPTSAAVAADLFMDFLIRQVTTE